MKHKIKYLLLSTFVIAIVGVSSNQTVLAEGGSVQTNGKVSFFDDTNTEPTSSTEPLDSSKDSNGVTGQSTYPETSGGAIAKPLGKLPSTGELVVKSLTISGGILLVLGALFILLKKKREAK